MDGLTKLLSSCVDVSNEKVFGYHKADPFENFDHGIIGNIPLTNIET